MQQRRNANTLLLTRTPRWKYAVYRVYGLQMAQKHRSTTLVSDQDVLGKHSVTFITIDAARQV